MKSEWIFNQIEALKFKKKINLLDFASGSGRNSIPLLKKNITITAIDNDQNKLNKYKHFNNINTICFDLETAQEWPLVKEYFDVIMVVNYLYRPKIKKIINLLKKNGYLFYETFSSGNERYGRPKNPNFLLKDRELLHIFGQDLLPISFFDGKCNYDKKAIKQRASFKKGVL